MLLRLLLLFTVVPLIELALLYRLAQQIEWGPTFALILLTGFVGAALARYEGVRCIARIRQKMAAGKMPADPLLDGLMILVAGALLITPGILTDVVGFMLLVPRCRRILKKYLKNRFQTRITVAAGRNHQARPTEHVWPAFRGDRADVIDVPSEESPDE